MTDYLNPTRQTATTWVLEVQRRRRAANLAGVLASDYTVNIVTLAALLREPEALAALSADDRAILARVVASSRRDRLALAELDAWLVADDAGRVSWLPSPYAPRQDFVGGAALYSLYWFGAPHVAGDASTRTCMHQAFSSQVFASREARRLRKIFGHVLARIDPVPAGRVGL